MAKVPITLIGYQCERCGHQWVPRGSSDQEPRVCPKCKSPYWNRPRRGTNKKKLTKLLMQRAVEQDSPRAISIQPRKPVPARKTPHQEWVIECPVCGPRPRPGVEPSVKSTFRQLADTWRKETAGSSLIQRKVMHPYYQRIIGLGPDALPLLLRELQRAPTYWFWALTSISGEDPIRPDATFDEAVADWLAWGRERGLIE